MSTAYESRRVIVQRLRDWAHGPVEDSDIRGVARDVRAVVSAFDMAPDELTEQQIKDLNEVATTTMRCGQDIRWSVEADVLVRAGWRPPGWPTASVPADLPAALASVDDRRLAYDLAADMCDQGARPARSVYHPGAWNRVSRVDSKYYEQHAVDVIQHIREHPKASADEWFVIDLAANLCDLCQRPRRDKFSHAAWERASDEEAGPPGSRKSEWWLAYARQVIERVQAARSAS